MKRLNIRVDPEEVSIDAEVVSRTVLDLAGERVGEERLGHVLAIIGINFISACESAGIDPLATLSDLDRTIEDVPIN